ncbi:class I SAM-dependent methyltransferase [Ruminococcus flavefaciens]|uniref:class I SAM-dependent methyltransferase n=1 Tax=Ruminococcus flavefaciens TaxID=1265 RepID=UPI000490D7C7|nr:class I SAM-dependent methyltransferase [Ruminococcus flavefaciens]
MEIKNKEIDGGKAFDFGKTSKGYAKYRDIYPKEFYKKLVDCGIGVSGQKCLDLGTGTGVIPRNMYQYGAEWTGTDISENQIAQARLLASANKMDIDFQVVSAEENDFPDESFDIITACQCFWYFDTKELAPRLAKMLKKDGRLVVMQMAWLPNEDRIAGLSEKLVLEYNPGWTGGGWEREPVHISDEMLESFDVVYRAGFDLNVHFTRESWNGRMKTCRGIGASLPEAEIAAWEREHRALLALTAPEEFDVLHYAAIAILKKK